MILEAAAANLADDDVEGVEVVVVDEGVEEDVVAEGVEVEAEEAHAGEGVEGFLGLAGDGVADDQGFVEADAVVEEAAVEGVEEVEEEWFHFGTGEDVEDGEEGGARVVESGLAAGPVEELQAGQDAAVGGAVPEDAEDEVLRERQREGGERGGDALVGCRRGQDFVDAVEESVGRGLPPREPRLERRGDVVLRDQERG